MSLHRSPITFEELAARLPMITLDDLRALNPVDEELTINPPDGSLQAQLSRRNRVRRQMWPADSQEHQTARYEHRILLSFATLKTNVLTAAQAWEQVMLDSGLDDHDFRLDSDAMDQARLAFHAAWYNLAEIVMSQAA
jgi:hypothetical protein